VLCSALCWKRFTLKKNIITSSAPKNGRIFLQENVTVKKCEININQNTALSGPSQVRLHLLQFFKLILVSKLYHLSVLR
jgi:hypothetical protein